MRLSLLLCTDVLVSSFRAAVLACLCAFGVAAGADVLQIKPLAPEAVSGPARGASMSSVEQAFGAPERKDSAVGEPPITRWVYRDFIVYFEGSLVLYATRRGE